MYEPHTLALLFKENHLRDQTPVETTTFSSTSDQFFSGWKSGSNQTLSILNKQSVQLKEPRRAQPFHENNHKATNFSQLILVPMYVRAGRPAFVWPYAGVHRSTSLMSSSLLLQQCPACLVRLTCIVFVMGGKWPCSWCLVGCCRQDLFNIALNILV